MWTLEQEAPIVQEPSGVEMSVENYSPFLSLINVKNKLEAFEADEDSGYDEPEEDEEDDGLDWDDDEFIDIDEDDEEDTFWTHEEDEEYEEDEEDEELIPDADFDLQLTDHEGTDEPIF